MHIRRLSPKDTPTYRRLRLRALRECPRAFGSSYAEEKVRPLKAFAERLEQTDSKWALGAWEGARLVGVASLIRESRPKEKHKAAIYGLYVAPSVRGKGFGRQLLVRAIEIARTMRGLRQVRIAVVAANRPALRLYESLRFKTYGREEAALFVGGRFYAELFLVRRL